MENCDDDTTYPQKYRQVECLFKSGCRGCNDYTFTRYLCKKCEETANTIDVTPLQERINALKERMFPQIQVADEDVEMKEKCTKRAKPENESDNDHASIQSKSAKCSA